MQAVKARSWDTTSTLDQLFNAVLGTVQNGKAADKFIKAVKPVLDGTTSAPAVATESFRTLGDGSTGSWTDAPRREA